MRDPVSAAVMMTGRLTRAEPGQRSGWRMRCSVSAMDAALMRARAAVR